MQKLELTNVSFGVRLEDFANLHPDDRHKVPDKLAEATITLLKLHYVNGDMGWVDDMIGEVGEGRAPETSLEVGTNVAIESSD